MAEEFRIALGVELESGQLDGIRNQINNIQVAPVALQIDTRNAQSQVDALRRQIQNLSNIRINLGTGNVGGGGGNGGIRRRTNEIAAAYNELMSLARRINSNSLQINKLDTTQNAEQIRVLREQINALIVRYSDLYDAFGQRLSTVQIDNLVRSFDIVNDKIEAVHGRLADTSATRQTQNEYKRLYDIAKQIENIKLKIGGLDGEDNSNEISELIVQLTDLRNTYNQLFNSFSGDLTPDQLDSFNRMLEESERKLAQLDAKIADTRANLANDIRVKFDNNTFENEISEITASFSKLNSKSVETSDAVKNFEDCFASLNVSRNSDDIDELISSYDRYLDALKNVKNQIEINSRSEKQSNDTTKLNRQKEALSTRMSVWLKENSAAAKQFGSQIESLRQKLESCNKVELDNISAEFREITQQAKLAEKSTLTFGDKLKKQLSEYTVYLSSASLITYGAQAIQSMYENVLEVDTAMTNLYKVTDETATRYDEFLKSSAKNSQELGRSMSSYIEQTANWAKMNFTIDESEELAKISSIYSNVAEVDDATAVSDLVTAMKSFNISASEAITILDPMNKLGKNLLPVRNYIG